MRLSVHARPLRILTFALAVGTAVALTSPARAATATTSYAALGDSYSSGLGAGSYYSSSGSCYRGKKAYAELWAAEHNPAAYAFVACSGATTSDVKSGQLSVLSSSTTLVTITIGGNDVDFAGVLTTCRLGSTEVCAAAVAAAKAKGEKILPDALATTYAAIRAAAPNAKLVVLGYPHTFESSTTCGVLSMSLANRLAVNSNAVAFNALASTQAAAAGATFVDAEPAFEGHRVCASSPWINGTVLPLANSYHPNAAGYSKGYLAALDAVTG